MAHHFFCVCNRLPRFYFLFLFIIIALLAFIFWPKPHLNPNGYRQLKYGMTRAQVEDAMGMPPGRYGNPNVPKRLLDVNNPQILVWADDEQVVLIAFDQDDHLEWKMFQFGSE